MPRVKKHKARTDIYRDGLRIPNPENKSGYTFDRSMAKDENDVVLVQKGQEYYSWAFKGDSKARISLEPPNRNQLTQNAFQLSLYDFEDRIAALSADQYDDFDTFQSDAEAIIEEIRSLAEEQDEKRQAMPEQLQETGSGELLGERYDGLDEWANDLEAVDLSYDEPEQEEGQSDEDYEEKKKEALSERLTELIDELQNIGHNL